ncbi:amidohydrolase family protein [Phycicoccus sp.]|uniref:amidohydrolase family protein n=1 Tax=Phycicoccus sp. TaxID=1902410 RepID=UPI002CE899B0|nr:amidohydrolase family protein [Phycicoccus sp.]HMM93438.1 amidohydrolase family protein [Phycicoccus sp.]
MDARRAGRALRNRARRFAHPAPRLDRFAPRSLLTLPEHHVPAAAVPAVDVHNHLGRWLTRDGSWMAPDVGRLLADLDACNIATVVNLDGRWSAELEANLDRYDRAHPERFATFCHVDWELLRRPDADERLAASLRASVDAGARGLKVWKDLGLDVTDAGGRRVLPDDPRLDGLWETAGELGVPVLIHVADPLAFFLPMDRHNERLEELRRFPGSSRAALGPEGRARLLESLETVVGRHPRTQWVAAHAAGCTEDLAWVSGLLAAHPNLVVDVAARVGELGRQPRATRRLVTDHPDQVLFGTDVFPFRAEEVRIYFRLAETEDEYFPYSTGEVPHAGRWTISGLGLEPELLEKLYAGNARRVLSGQPAGSPSRTER